MGQNTIYLNAEAEAKMRKAAKASNTSLSQWIAALVREKADKVWPDSVKEMAGSWEDFPDLAQIRSTGGVDVPRESV